MDKKEITQALDLWVKAMEAHDIEGLLALYHPKAGFWGTIAQELATDLEGAKQYFTTFISRMKPKKVHYYDSYVQCFGGEVLHAGSYDFTVDEDGVEKVVKVRFTFTYTREKEGGPLLIASHHSSFFP